MSQDEGLPRKRSAGGTGGCPCPPVDLESSWEGSRVTRTSRLATPGATLDLRCAASSSTATTAGGVAPHDNSRYEDRAACPVRRSGACARPDHLPSISAGDVGNEPARCGSDARGRLFGGVLRIVRLLRKECYARSKVQSREVSVESTCRSVRSGPSHRFEKSFSTGSLAGPGQVPNDGAQVLLARAGRRCRLPLRPHGRVKLLSWNADMPGAAQPDSGSTQGAASESASRREHSVRQNAAPR